MKKQIAAKKTPAKATAAKKTPAKATAAKKTPAQSKAAPAPAAPGADPRVTKLLGALRSDPRLAPVVAAFEEGASAPRGRKFGSNGLKVNDKLFALFTQGTLVVKLPRERVAALVASSAGKLFDPGHGRLMKEWLTVESAEVSWADLAREAHDFVSGAGR